MAERKQENPDRLNVSQLLNATKGFDYLFTDDIDAARKHFEKHDDSFHLLGLGVCAFLEAALGMESGLMTEASRCLSLAEAGTRKQMKVPKPADLSYRSRFRYGLEWEILNADAVVLLGLTHAINESYMGYLQCMYALNSAHSKFTKLYKTVFPQGLPETAKFSNSFSRRKVSTTLPSEAHPRLLLSRNMTSSSDPSLSTISASGSSNVSPAVSSPTGNGFFSRWLGTATLSVPALPSEITQDGPIEDLIVSGTAFGFGLFNLILSLLPKKVQGIVGFFGFQHDRALALQALAVSADKLDVHGVFASLVLMTYMSVVLLLSGYQADEQRMLKGYEEIISNVEHKYPSGTLWVLNRAKIKRMACDAAAATVILQAGLEMDRPRLFVQADIMMYFELAWTLLSQAKYHEAGEAFMAITKLNSWSHGTYYFIAGGCYLAAGNTEKAQRIFDVIPEAIERKKIAGRELPTEVFIKKKLAFYLEKQTRRGGESRNWIEAVKINPAEEIGIFWNMHSRVAASIAQSRIKSLTALTPLPPLSDQLLENQASPSEFLPVESSQPNAKPSPDDLDNPEELAVRALLLGINYRTNATYEMARHFLVEASRNPVVINTWIAGLAMFELAVLDLKEAEMYTKGHNIDREQVRSTWADALKNANARLDVALNLSGSDVDLSGRLDSRIAMLRDEIAAKKEMEGVT